MIDIQKFYNDRVSTKNPLTMFEVLDVLEKLPDDVLVHCDIDRVWRSTQGRFRTNKEFIEVAKKIRKGGDSIFILDVFKCGRLIKKYYVTEILVGDSISLITQPVLAYEWIPKKLKYKE